MNNDETFITRWARRKLEAKRSDPAKVNAKNPDAAGSPAGTSVPEDNTPLPSLDDITPEGDIVAFLQKRVPAELQKLALRKAWTSDPVISSFIEVAENQYDWNAINGVPGFGPMDPSWNIDALLAQATGATGLPEDKLATELSTSPVVAVAEPPDCDNLTQNEKAQAADAQTGHPQGHDAPHSSQTYEDAARTRTALATLDKHLFELSNSDMNEVNPTDTPKETQRLALQHPRPNPQGRHGGALPE